MNYLVLFEKFTHCNILRETDEDFICMWSCFQLFIASICPNSFTITGVLYLDRLWITTNMNCRWWIFRVYLWWAASWFPVRWLWSKFGSLSIRVVHMQSTQLLGYTERYCPLERSVSYFVTRAYKNNFGLRLSLPILMSLVSLKYRIVLLLFKVGIHVPPPAVGFMFCVRWWRKTHISWVAWTVSSVLWKLQ